MQEFKKKASDRMNVAVDVLKKDFASLRTGRASLALLDSITVDYYGTQTPVNQVATLGIPDPRQITIQPWEQKIIPEIEKAILKSGLGLTPSNDGKTIRLNIPALTEERRKELVKIAKKRAEEARVAVRNIRRDINEEVKKAEKEQHLSEDDVKKLHEEIQKTTDSYIAKVEDVLQHKEKEILEV
ncbi:MAG: ribosome recycling factor [Nitrospirae bacterium]|nr:ribosome recycling factor [Nitrospirota bacterium]MCL5978344.1 ribosome recycling factor [Nitrospirota bacterium]